MIPITLKKFKNLFVLSKPVDGNRIPIREAKPTAIPKKPRGIPNM